MGCACSSSNLPEWRQQIDAMLASNAVPGLLQLFKRVVPKATSVKKSVSANVIRASIKEYFSGTNASSATVDFVRYVHRLSPVAYEPFRRAATQKEFLALGKAFLADDDKVSSLEAMVARQLETAAKMLKAAEGLDVKKAVQDYVRFLLLFRRVPRGTVLVPTLLQDLVWHAHMRYPLEYARATVRLCGFFLDHSDEIPEENLAAQRRVTADAMRSLNRTVTEASNTDNTTTMLVPATYAPCAGMLPPVPGATCGGAVTQGDDHHHHHAACGGTTTHHTTCGGNTGSVCGGGGHHSSCGGGGGSHHHSSCGGGHHSSCGGGHHSSCGGATTSTCGGATTSTCGGATSSCGGAIASSCGGATSSCGGGGTTSSCGGATSSCGGATSSCGGSS